MRITKLSLRDFRSYERADFDLADGVTVVEGPVGAGKTNLLEGLYFACTGRSCRTSNERELVRFGESVARATLDATARGLDHHFEVALQVGPKRVKSVRADGRDVASMADVDERPLVCIFLPDRLELVKGPAGSRRAHLDTFIAALWPARRAARAAYARALAQRNVLLGRVRAGLAAQESLASWDAELARAGAELIADRREAVGVLAEYFEARADQLGLPGPAALTYRPRSRAADADELARELAEAIENDLARGFTTHGPHRDELRLEAAERDLRRYGSQGQQRLGLLALLLAERDALGERTDRPPLLLLDDVLSELDAERRRLLLAAVADSGQTLITTADTAAAAALGEAVTQLVIDAGRLAA